MCDFETTVYKGQVNTEVWASASVELFTEDVKIFHSIEEQFDYFKSLDTNICAYYHNLKFDGAFWLSYLLVDLGFKQAYTPLNEQETEVEWLKEKDCGCVTLKLNGTLAVCVGWSDGFDPDDETVIHSKTSPTYAICAAIKAWGSDDLRTDLDYIDSPYYEDGGVYDTEMTVYPDDKYYLWVATNFLNEFDSMKELDIDEKGLIHE